ncbi:MAG TPA: phosphohydrolase, partial [Solirubrobacteraceae bacterium]|nr:phosphohydrolase [Solirubrobacteraceae bacterium]
EGRLLGHLVIGQRLITQRAGGLEEGRLLALLHCVMAHHGPAALPGARFQSGEALALYRLNSLDAAVKGAFEGGATQSSE